MLFTNISTKHQRRLYDVVENHIPTTEKWKTRRKKLDDEPFTFNSCVQWVKSLPYNSTVCSPVDFAQKIYVYISCQWWCAYSACISISRIIGLYKWKFQLGDTFWSDFLWYLSYFSIKMMKNYAIKNAWVSVAI